jgi:hypothetical protein
LRQEDQESNTSLGYIVRTYKNKNKTKARRSIITKLELSQDYKNSFKSGMVVYAYNLRTLEAEAGG